MKGVLDKQTILKKAKVSSLNDVQHLNFWGTYLVDISIVEQIPNLETASLSVNNIKTLKNFSACKKLKELFLRKNDIENLSDLYYLRDIKTLQTLWLSDNPIVDRKDYRLFTIAVLPQITKLDEVDITKDEQNLAKKMFPNPEESVPLPPELAPKSSSSKSSHKSDSAKLEVAGGENQVRVLQAISTLLPTLDAAHLDSLALKISEEKRNRAKK